MFGLFRKSQRQNSQLDITTLYNFSKLLGLTKDYSTLAKTGYIENVIVNTCIHRTADAVNSIPKDYYLNGKKIEPDSNVPRLIRSIISAIDTPSSDCSNNLFLESVLSSYMIGGESYIYPAQDSIENVSNLEYLNPIKMSVLESNDNRVHQYQYNNGSKRYVFTREYTQINTDSINEKIENPSTLENCFNLIIFKTFNPDSETRGLSKLTSAGLSIDGHNYANKWNNALMKNSGKPSGMLSFQSVDGTELSEDQLSELKTKLDNEVTGANRGSILVSNNMAKFDKFSMTSQEMDFIQGIVQRSIDICNALDYPPYLLGFTGATFSNQDSAKLALYENSAIPKFNLIWGGISDFLSKKYSINFEIKPRLSEVVALFPRMKEKNEGVLKQWESNLIDQNEARDLLGYESKTGGDNLYFSDFRMQRNNNDLT